MTVLQYSLLQMQSDVKAGQRTLHVHHRTICCQNKQYPHYMAWVDISTSCVPFSILLPAVANKIRDQVAAAQGELNWLEGSAECIKEGKTEDALHILNKKMDLEKLALDSSIVQDIQEAIGMYDALVKECHTVLEDEMKKAKRDMAK